MPKFISVQETADLVKDGMTIAIGGFLGCGNPHHVIDELVKKGVKDLTIIANDSPAAGYGLAKLIDNHQVKRLIASHVGLNPNVATQMNDGSMEVWLIPQGSLAEMIRAGGGGLVDVALDADEIFRPGGGGVDLGDSGGVLSHGGPSFV